MKECKKCGTLLSDVVTTCGKCGQPVEEPVRTKPSMQTNSAGSQPTFGAVNQSSSAFQSGVSSTVSFYKPVNSTARAVIIFKLLVCIAGIIMGIVIINFKGDFPVYTDSVSSAMFGADFYTEIHDAASTAANNISDTAYLIQKIGRSLMIAIGSGFILCSLYSMFSCIGELAKKD